MSSDTNVHKEIASARWAVGPHHRIYLIGCGTKAILEAVDWGSIDPAEIRTIIDNSMHHMVHSKHPRAECWGCDQ